MPTTSLPDPPPPVYRSRRDEGGYSEAHVPFCGHAVLEALSQSAIHAEDPLESRISGQQPDPRFDALEETRLREIASLHRLV